MALYANIQACTYWNGYLYYSTSALRHFSSPPCPTGGGPENVADANGLLMVMAKVCFVAEKDNKMFHYLLCV